MHDSRRVPAREEGAHLCEMRLGRCASQALHASGKARAPAGVRCAYRPVACSILPPFLHLPVLHLLPLHAAPTSPEATGPDGHRCLNECSWRAAKGICGWLMALPRSGAAAPFDSCVKRRALPHARRGACAGPRGSARFTADSRGNARRRFRAPAGDSPQRVEGRLLDLATSRTFPACAWCRARA